MKRNALIAAVALAASAIVAVPAYRATVGRARRSQVQRNLRFYATPALPPLSLDSKTASILAGAGRVETFRLADYHEHLGRPPEEFKAMETRKFGKMGTFTIVRVGAPRDREFSLGIARALGQASVGMAGSMCFDPGVGFRSWRGRESVDVAICFNCSGIEITTRDASRKVIKSQRADLGQSRSALWALSGQAFPDDKRFQQSAQA